MSATQVTACPRVPGRPSLGREPRRGASRLLSQTAILAALVASCSSAAGPTAVSGTAVSGVATATLPSSSAGAGSTPGASVPSSASATAAITISEADSGKTFEVARTARVALRLTNRERWTPPAVAGTSVTLISVAYLVDPGFSEWTVTPVSTGTSTITSTGEPNCPAGSPCPTTRTAFSVTVDVR